MNFSLLHPKLYFRFLFLHEKKLNKFHVALFHLAIIYAHNPCRYLTSICFLSSAHTTLAYTWMLCSLCALSLGLHRHLAWAIEYWNDVDFLLNNFHNDVLPLRMSKTKWNMWRFFFRYELPVSPSLSQYDII